MSNCDCQKNIEGLIKDASHGNDDNYHNCNNRQNIFHTKGLRVEQERAIYEPTAVTYLLSLPSVK